MGRLVAQSVKYLTVALGSGHDLLVMGSSPTLGYTLSRKSAQDSLPLSSSAPSPSTREVPISQINKSFLKKKTIFPKLRMKPYSCILNKHHMVGAKSWCMWQRFEICSQLCHFSVSPSYSIAQALPLTVLLILFSVSHAFSDFFIVLPAPDTCWCLPTPCFCSIQPKKKLGIGI